MENQRWSLSKEKTIEHKRKSARFSPCPFQIRAFNRLWKIAYPEMSEKFHFSELFENSYFREHPWTPFTLDISKKLNFWKIYILNMHFLSCKFILYILLYNSFYYFLQNHLKLEQETNKKHMQHSPPLIFLINQSNSKIEIKWY